MKTTRRIEVRIETRKTIVVRAKRRNEKPRFRSAADDDLNEIDISLASSDLADNMETEKKRTKGAKQ